ncbi:hypothetical protein B0H19DRAFT_188400 [Mycena capillaripes]|nr:hypothetical protein B0H19DRAFT_188400 [Mycena capillaripes]
MWLWTPVCRLLLPTATSHRHTSTSSDLSILFCLPPRYSTMPSKFTKTLSTLNTKQLLSAAADFHIPLPATYTVPQLRSLVKVHMTSNPELMRDPNYAMLFTKRVRDTYLANNPEPLSPTPSSWHGINPGSERSSRAGSRTPPGSHGDAESPEPRDLDEETRLHLLQTLSVEDLEKALGILHQGESLFLSVPILFLPPHPIGILFTS